MLRTCSTVTCMQVYEIQAVVEPDIMDFFERFSLASSSTRTMTSKGRRLAIAKPTNCTNHKIQSIAVRLTSHTLENEGQARISGASGNGRGPCDAVIILIGPDLPITHSGVIVET